MSHLEIEELTARAADLEANGAFAAAMHARERLLLFLQPLHGDPSPQTDHQKLLLSKLILKVVDARDDRAATSKRSTVRSKLPSSSASSTAALSSSKHQTPLLTESLSSHGLLAFAERLLSAGNTLPATQDDPEVLDVRAKLLLGIGQVLFRQGRPRAALPVVQRAVAQLRRNSNQAPTLEIASGHLTLCALHSASSHHEAALLEAHRALGTVLQVEEEIWRCDPATSPNDAQNSDNSASAAASAPSGERRKVYYGAFQAACYHNLSTEQEHLGLLSLALESCQTGFELSLLANGAAHPLSQRLRRAYSEIFTSLHFRNFANKKPVLTALFSDADAAVVQLNRTYLDSMKHREAMARELAQQELVLRRVEAAIVPGTLSTTTPLSNTQRLLRSKIRPQSAMSASAATQGSASASRHR